MTFKTSEPHTKPCFLRGVRGQDTACCEDWKRIVKYLRAQYGRRDWRKPEQTFVCKDCCIDPPDGHRCTWWSLCW